MWRMDGPWQPALEGRRAGSALHGIQQELGHELPEALRVLATRPPPAAPGRAGPPPPRRSAAVGVDPVSRVRPFTRACSGLSSSTRFCAGTSCPERRSSRSMCPEIPPSAATSTAGLSFRRVVKRTSSISSSAPCRAPGSLVPLGSPLSWARRPRSSPRGRGHDLLAVELGQALEHPLVHRVPGKILLTPLEDALEHGRPMTVVRSRRGRGWCPGRRPCGRRTRRERLTVRGGEEEPWRSGCRRRPPTRYPP